MIAARIPNGLGMPMYGSRLKVLAFRYKGKTFLFSVALSESFAMEVAKVFFSKVFCNVS